MKLVKPSFRIITHTPAPLMLIEEAGRTCYKSEKATTLTSSWKFAEKIIKQGHLSVIEHASATVKFVVDRGVSHELVRHRLCSFSQESTRYCDYAGGHVTFVIPPWCSSLTEGEIETSNVLLVRSAFLHGGADDYWLLAMAKAELCYKELRRIGWSPQQARSILPNSLKTEIVVTANFREWLHIFQLRTAPAAHPQMREIMIPVCREFQHKFPIVFDGVNHSFMPAEIARACHERAEEDS